MNWEVILELVKTIGPILIDCIDGESRIDEAALFARLRKLEGIDAVRARRGFRKQGVPFRELDDRVRELRSQLSEATDDDLREVVQMARELAA